MEEKGYSCTPFELCTVQIGCRLNALVALFPEKELHVPIGQEVGWLDSRDGLVVARRNISDSDVTEIQSLIRRPVFSNYFGPLAIGKYLSNI
jgi:hypothetical protein